LSLLSALGVAAALYLPETLHQKLPETMVEAQAFGKNQVSCFHQKLDKNLGLTHYFQKFWSIPKPQIASPPKSNGTATTEEEEMLNTKEFTP
jgi:hypothetical protein